VKQTVRILLLMALIAAVSFASVPSAGASCYDDGGGGGGLITC
jgi:hypothetical protein